MTSTCIVYAGSMPVRRSLNKGATRIYFINCLTLLFDISVLFIFFFHIYYYSFLSHDSCCFFHTIMVHRQFYSSNKI